MVKTVFGRPGVGDKSEGGDAVAPEGAPGARSSGDLPQKAGNKSPLEQPTTPMKAKPTSKPAEKMPPMAKPAMAKPAQKKVAEGKTVFGMPALNMPMTPGAAPAQPKAPSPDQPATARPKDPVKRDTPAGLHAPDMETTSMEAKETAAQPEDAYKATVVGMGAADAKEPKTEEPSLEETRDTETSPDDPEGGAPQADDVHAETLAAGSEEASDISTAMGKAVKDLPQSPGTEQPPLWLLIVLIGIIVILIVLAAYFLFF